MSDVVLPPQRGLPDGLVIPGAELQERFSRSSGPGGQGVNTTDVRVELRWDVTSSHALSTSQRDRLMAQWSSRLVDGVLSVTASEHRAQLQNRLAARARLRMLLAEALQPPAPTRRATRPSRSAKRRRLEAKRRRGDVKQARRRPPPE